MPVVTKVHQDKDKLLSLFLMIDQNDVKEQLKHCKDFFTMFHNDDKGGACANQGIDGFDFEEEGKDGEDGDKKDGKDGRTPSSDETKKNEQGQKNESHKNKFSRKNKKLKKYSTNYFMLILKLLVFISVLESYFLY